MIKNILLALLLLFSSISSINASTIESGEEFKYSLKPDKFSFLPVRGISRDSIKKLDENESLEFYVFKKDLNFNLLITSGLSKYGKLSHLNKINLSTYNPVPDSTLVIFNNSNEEINISLSASSTFNSTYFPLKAGENFITTLDSDFFNYADKNEDILYMGCFSEKSRTGVSEDHKIKYFGLDLYINYLLGSDNYKSNEKYYGHYVSLNNDGETPLTLNSIKNCKNGDSGYSIFLYTKQATEIGSMNFNVNNDGGEYCLYDSYGCWKKNKIKLTESLGEKCTKDKFNTKKTLDNGEIGICLFTGENSWIKGKWQWMGDTLSKCSNDKKRRNCKINENGVLVYEDIMPDFEYYKTGMSIPINTETGETNYKYNTLDCTDNSMLGYKLSSDYKCRRNSTTSTLMNNDLSKCYDGLMTITESGWYDMGSVLVKSISPVRSDGSLISPRTTPYSKKAYKCTSSGWQELCQGETDENGVYETGYKNVTVPNLGAGYLSDPKACLKYNPLYPTIKLKDNPLNYEILERDKNGLYGYLVIDESKLKPGHELIAEKFDYTGKFYRPNFDILCYKQGGIFRGHLSEKIGKTRNTYAYYCLVQKKIEGEDSMADNSWLDRFCGDGKRSFYTYTSSMGIGKPYCNFEKEEVEEKTGEETEEKEETEVLNGEVAETEKTEGQERNTEDKVKPETLEEPSILKVAEYGKIGTSDHYPKIYIKRSGNIPLVLLISNGNAKGYAKAMHNIQYDKTKETIGNICKNLGGNPDYTWIYKPNGTTIGVACNLTNREKSSKVLYVFDLYNQIFERDPHVNIKKYFVSEDNEEITSTGTKDELLELLSKTKEGIRGYLAEIKIEDLCTNHNKEDYDDMECKEEYKNEIIKGIKEDSEISTKKDIEDFYNDFFKEEKEKE